MMPSAPMSVAFWMLDSNASGMRTIGAAPTLAPGAGGRRILRGRQEDHGRDGEEDRDRKTRSKHKDLGLKCAAHYGAFRVSVALKFSVLATIALYASVFAQTARSQEILVRSSFFPSSAAAALALLGLAL